MKKILLTSVAMVTVASSAHALTESRTATVDVVSALSVTTVTDLNFGKVQRPAEGASQTVIVDVDNLISGTATLTDNTSISAGEYEIAGDSVATVGITVADSGNVDGLTLSAFELAYDSSAIANGATGLNAANGGKTLMVGGTLTIAEASLGANGTFTPGYTITVNYQ
jgi:hypothetical protein